MQFNNLLTWVGASALAVAAFAMVQHGQGCCPGMGAQTGTTASATIIKGVQKVAVTINGGYSPSVVQVVAGKPVELTFTRTEKSGCGGQVVIKGLNYSKAVASGKSIVVKFTPKKADDIPFTCGMGMISGKIVVTNVR
ncbi:hypothetical protein BH11ARM1_BH11ARM1_15360 [soil metagenome]